MAELIAETSLTEENHPKRYKDQKLEPEEKVAKPNSKVRVLEEFEEPLSFGENKVFLPPPTATY